MEIVQQIKVVGLLLALLNNGLIVAFGYQNKTSTYEVTFNFPISFLNRVNCVATPYGSSGQLDYNDAILNLTLTSMNYKTNFSQSIGIWYIAIGY